MSLRPTTTLVNRLLAAALFFGIMAPAAGSEAFHLAHGGAERAYRLHVPGSYEKGSPVPLVIVLHGRSGNGQRMENLTEFDSRADEHGFIVAYPEALNGTWNYLHDISGYKPSPNDSDFLLALVASLVDEYDIDSRRVYAAGISNGGYMTQRLACYAPAKFAAFASVAAGGYGAMPVECEDHRPVNILYIHGTEDALVPWRGARARDGSGGLQLVAMSLTDSLKFWSQRNRCGPEVSRRELPRKGESPGTVVQLLTADSCEAGAEVSLYAVVGGGHNWPGSRGVIRPEVAGRVNMDIHASDAIWSFFERNGPSRE